ncbi:PLP-dependent aminotransferase family protein [Ktedonobacter robiniae]|uniref:2-aminoadipate aminotransferase n=1 Tax=Ktedonobacter robiniae TaxID=2778365 RepID=A0ABQ3V5J0_9CHLR|nr:PLP-dependent aminotransferase family protein [Ktedonobacter robiniae]GHO60144.1 2-aminoadipate aminotransferase [Ktedonobacter robiniae]
MQGPTTTEKIALADWAQSIQQSTIQQLLAVATHPGHISFALGLPAAELFPIEGYTQATLQLLQARPNALQYGMPEGGLKRHIVKLMELRNVSCREEQVFLTAGAQQGISLIARLLLNAKGTVLMEETIYSGIVQAIEPLQPRILTVPSDPRTGMDVDAVVSFVEGGERPAFIYAISDGHNPLGVSLSLEKRQRLVALARRFQIPIVEDDPYGLLWYNDEQVQPSMKALDADWVFYLGSFSKILAPALRVGWLVVPEQLGFMLSALKEGSDINTASFAQRSIASYMDTGLLPDHLIALRKEYSLRRDTMVRAIQKHFPESARFHPVNNGMFLWVELPAKIDTERLLNTAIEEECVAFVPGSAFSMGSNSYASHCMRLNFSNCNAQRIEEGIARLGRVIARFLAD